MQKPNRSIKDTVLFQAMASFLEINEKRNSSNRTNLIKPRTAEKKVIKADTKYDSKESLKRKRDELKYQLGIVKKRQSELEIKLMLLRNHSFKFKNEVHDLKTIIKNNQTLFVMML